MEVSGGARFLMALLMAFLVTLIVLGGAGYAITRIAVSPAPDIFRAAAFEFELAPGWWCELDGTEYVCSPPGKSPYAATAIIAMKERNDQDNLKAYEDHLRQLQKPCGGSRTEPIPAEMPCITRRVIGSHEWVEAFLAGSEVPNFDTYYLGTNTAYLGILVTLSVHKDYSRQYIAQLNDMIRTLNIYQR
jgi:hypothetical protein